MQRRFPLRILALLLLAPAAHADPSAADQALAQSLFEQGKRLMADGRYAEACDKLQESQRLDPSGGTSLNLALCREQEGKIASAWTEFKTALSLARRDGRNDRAAAAEKHIAELEPKLPKLRIQVAEPADEETISIDGTALGRAGWASPVAIDPGSHEISANAPGRRAWTTTVTAVGGREQSVEIPPLEKAPAAAVATGGGTSTKDSGIDEGSGSRTAGWIVGGIGLASLGVGSYFGVQAISKRKDSDKECPTDTTCTAEGVRLNNQANTAAWVANFGVGLGIVGLGVGTYLLLSSGGSSDAEESSGSRSPTLSIDAAVLPGGGAMSVAGAW